MDRRRGHSGFTLLELVLVMVILCTVLAIAAPSLHGWGRGSALRDVADQFVAMTRLARTQAVATCQQHRLCIESSGIFYLSIRQGDQFIPILSGPGRAVQLAEDMRIELMAQPVEGQENVGDCIDFFPTGRTQPARVRLYDMAGEYYIQCFSPAEAFQVVRDGSSL